MQSGIHKTQADLVSTRRELDWVKVKLSGTRSEEESTHKRLAEEGGEVEWLKNRLAETQGEQESSRNEVEGLRRLNPLGAGLFLRLVLPGYHLALRAVGRALGRTLSAQRRFPPLVLGLRHRGRGIRITGSTISHQLEVGTITISAGGNCPLFFFLIRNSLWKFVCIEYIYLATRNLSWTMISYEWRFDSVCYFLSVLQGMIFFVSLDIIGYTLRACCDFPVLYNQT